MKEIRSYENFPARLVLLYNLFTISTYAIGAYILAGLGIIFSALYLLYCLWAEIRVLKRSCVNCYYYGKVCGTGKGKLSSLLFKKGSPEIFVKDEISFYDVLPDFMVFIFPIVGGIVLSILNFTWLILTLLVILAILSFGGNAVMRGSFVCKYCKQREIGCPAERLFSKERAQNNR